MERIENIYFATARTFTRRNLLRSSISIQRFQTSPMSRWLACPTDDTETRSVVGILADWHKFFIFKYSFLFLFACCCFFSVWTGLCLREGTTAQELRAIWKDQIGDYKILHHILFTASHRLLLGRCRNLNLANKRWWTWILEYAYYST